MTSLSEMKEMPYHVTEAGFMNECFVVAKLHGWTVAHFGASQNPSGNWLTPVRFNAKGYPDLTLAHPRLGVMFRELKTGANDLSKDQRAWIDLLYKAGANAAVWRPEDWPRIVSELKGTAKPCPSSSPSSPWPDHL